MNRRKLEVPMEAAMPCKMGTKMRSKQSRVTDDETKGSNTIPKDSSCMHRGSTLIHETALGIHSTQRS